MSGNKILDFETNNDQKTINLTNTINDDLFSSSSNNNMDIISEITDLKAEDYDDLKQIMNDLVDFKNSSEQLNIVPNICNNNIHKPKLNRLDSIQMALGDYCLNDFENFEANIQMNGDPMLGNTISNIIL